MRHIEWQLQTTINNLVKWCDIYGHTISASKSCCVHFCRKRDLHPDSEMRFSDVHVSLVPDVRLLGVVFDHRNSLSFRIFHICGRGGKSL
ncbi:RNase H domain-containing protein [Trichonephila clavipes]|nr:RNase H domain-containing protein [Trichonephila clavipes]